ncbi:MAG: ParA family protein, partial [Planktomarina sp.]
MRAQQFLGFQMSDEPKKTPQILAVANQKGGVGKTTTTLNLAAAFVESGLKVLILDLDPQGNASTGLGVMADDRVATSYDVLVEQRILPEYISETSVPGLYLVPATTDLSSADLELAAAQGRSHLLAKALATSDLSKFDYIFMDCPPSLNVLTVNALVAANSLLIPLQSEFFALEGLSQLLMSVRSIPTFPSSSSTRTVSMSGTSKISPGMSWISSHIGLVCV